MKVREKVNILMIDDQPAKLLSYEAILAELGENLIRANSGREALNCLLKTDIAVVLLDVSMPEMDGFELADMIRGHPRFQKTAIIFISAVHLTDLDRLKGYERGAVDYISVPIVPELLRAKVAIFAELHRRARELELLNGEMRHFSSKLIAAQDQERRRIARELHDSMGQNLTAARILLQNSLKIEQPAQRDNQVAEVCALIDHAIQEVRNISYLLHPPLLDEAGLQSSLGWYLDGIKKRSGIEIFMDIQPLDFPRLAPDLEIAAFRIVQEALTNIFRHSGARKAWVALIINGDKQVAVTVRDDGRGISERTAKFQPDSIGVGIGGMRQRIKELGGELQMRNANPGTLVEATIPTETSALRNQVQGTLP